METTLHTSTSNNAQTMETPQGVNTRGKQRPKNLLGLVGVEDASTMLGLSVSSLYRYIHKRAIPHYKVSGRLIYFDTEELKEWVKRHKVKTRDELALEAQSIKSIAQPQRGRGRGRVTSLLGRNR